MKDTVRIISACRATIDEIKDYEKKRPLQNLVELLKWRKDIASITAKPSPIVFQPA